MSLLRSCGSVLLSSSNFFCRLISRFFVLTESSSCAARRWILLFTRCAPTDSRILKNNYLCALFGEFSSPSSVTDFSRSNHEQAHLPLTRRKSLERPL